MAVTRARKTEIAQRRKQVAELYVQGWTQCAIAEKLGVTQACICLDLQKLQKEWRESRTRDFDAVRELEIQKLDRLEREAWAAWERSQKPSQSAEFKDDSASTPSKKKVKDQVGDPRFRESYLYMPNFGINNTTNKLVRIRSLTQYLAQGAIRFKGGSPGARLLVEQLRDFPLGDHDDGPDALEMAIRMACDLLNSAADPPEDGYEYAIA